MRREHKEFIAKHPGHFVVTGAPGTADTDVLYCAQCREEQRSKRDVRPDPSRFYSHRGTR